jgi:hypothetical protein
MGFFFQVPENLFDFSQNRIFLTYFNTSPSTKYHCSLSSGSWFVPAGKQKARHDEVNNRFSLFADAPEITGSLAIEPRSFGLLTTHYNDWISLVSVANSGDVPIWLKFVF